MEEKRFRKNDDRFVCAVCGRDVKPLRFTSRNHCPFCLSSVHLDVNPGDRAAECGGIMDAVKTEPDPKKGFVSLPLNLLHAAVVLFLVYTAYNALNALLIGLLGLDPASVPLGVEPILFGLLYLGFDLLLIALKHTARNVLKDAQKKADSAR